MIGGVFNGLNKNPIFVRGCEYMASTNEFNIKLTRLKLSYVDHDKSREDKLKKKEFNRSRVYCLAK